MQFDLDLSISVALVLVAFLSMALFGFLQRGKPRNPEVARHTSILIFGWLHAWFLWLFDPIVRLLVRLRVSPDALAISGLVSSLLSGLGYHAGRPVIGGWMLLLCGIFDVLDGKIARKTNRVSLYGAFMDSTLDRYAESAVFLGIISHFHPSKPMTLISTVALVGSLMVSYTKARGESLGVNCSVGLMQRPERIVYLGAASVLTAPFARLIQSLGLSLHDDALLAFTLFAIALLSLTTSLYRFFHIIGALKQKAQNAPGGAGSR